MFRDNLNIFWKKLLVDTNCIFLKKLWITKAKNQSLGKKWAATSKGWEALILMVMTILPHLCCNNAQFIINTFVQHQDFHNYTSNRRSLDKGSFIDFCFLLADLCQSVLDLRVIIGAELSIDHHLLIWNFCLKLQQGLHESPGLIGPID